MREILMNSITAKTVRMAHALMAACLLCSCSGSDSPAWHPDRATKAYGMAYRQLPPQPVYNRLRWVQLPEVLPARNVAETSAPSIRPIYHLDMKDATLEEVSRTLAAIPRYSSYCSSRIATRKVTINRLGTFDELVGEISSSANITVQVDDEGKTVRFLPKLAVQPEFFGGETGQVDSDKQVLNNKVGSDEHQSLN